jgi:ABC-2 type transport system permease protein
MGSGTELLARPAPVRLPPSGARHNLRAVRVVWQRELIRFIGDRARLVSSLVQPLLFLFVLGTGLSGLVDTGPGGADFRTFLFPGVVATSIAFTAAFSGISLVWDREFGFLREMLVAPIPTWVVITGKCLGGATTATIQSAVLLPLAGLVGVPYAPLLLLELLLLMFTAAFLVTALGTVLAGRVRHIQTAFPLVQLIITPMMFMSGALFPLSGLPAWLAVATRLNPFTYVVEPMKGAVLGHVPINPAVRHTLAPGIDWFGWSVPTVLQIAIVVLASLVALAIAIARFDRTE